MSLPLLLLEQAWSKSNLLNCIRYIFVEDKRERFAHYASNTNRITPAVFTPTLELELEVWTLLLLNRSYPSRRKCTADMPGSFVGTIRA